MAITLSQIQTWLDEAMAAKHSLMTGQAVAKVGGPDGQVEFRPQDADRLDGWISTLQGWIARGGMPSSGAGASYRPIGFGF